MPTPWDRQPVEVDGQVLICIEASEFS